MSLTLIRKPAPNGEIINMLFKTDHVHVEKEEGSEEMVEVLTASTAIVDDKLKPLMQPSLYKVEEMTEKEFHTTLRVQAAEHGHLITSHCTDPEWNPKDYTKNLEDELD